MSSLNTTPKFFYDENFKWDSEYKIDYYKLLYESTTEIEVNNKFIGITTPSTTSGSNVLYTVLIGHGVKKYISSTTRLTS